MKLTKRQELFYYIESHAGVPLETICGSVLIAGGIGESEIAHAVDMLYRINDVLRARVHTRDGVTEQEVCEYKEKAAAVRHFESEAEMERYARDISAGGMDPRIEMCVLIPVILPGKFGFIAKYHQMAGDVSALAVLGRQFKAILNGVAPAGSAIEDELAEEAEYYAGTCSEQDWAFFSEQYSRSDSVTYLSEKHCETNMAGESVFPIGVRLSAAVREYAAAHDTEPYAVLMTVLAAAASRIHMNDDIIYIGFAESGDYGGEENGKQKLYTNALPVLLEQDNGKSFADAFAGVSQAIRKVSEHRKYSHAELLRRLSIERDLDAKLFDISLQCLTKPEEDDVYISAYRCGEHMESIRFYVEEDRGSDQIDLRIIYLTEKYDDDDIYYLFKRLMLLLADALENDRRKLHELRFMTDREKRLMVSVVNDTYVDVPQDRRVHTMFEDRAAMIPDRPAVIACDRTLTYSGLNEAANRIAHGLIGRGVGVGDIVAFALPRKSCLPVVMLGILKAGAAYLPLDPSSPKERTDYIVNDCRAGMYITEDNLDELLDSRRSDDPGLPVPESAPCYCIYTSGSTGRPKGVLLSHRNVVNYLHDNPHNQVVHALLRDGCETVASVTTCGFDIFVTESLLPLVYGMTVILADEEQAKLQSELNPLLLQYRADAIQTTPSKMKSLIMDETQLDYLKNMKAVILGGEALDALLVKRLKRITDAEIYNIYGPTEATVWATNIDVTRCVGEIPIGKPIANTQVYIVDRFMNLMPYTFEGELCIAGDGVGIGYLNRPELNAEKFIDNPFGSGKLYKTGDIAYRRMDGELIYVGRNDYQVKIRGLRIELGEIEAAISDVPGVRQAAVVVRKNSSGRQMICAFYSGDELPVRAIRDRIENMLPGYMLPHYYTWLAEMPMTASGKINRKALPEINIEKTERESVFVPPKTDMQRTLCRAMEKILGVSSVGLVDDFFELGGDSLKAIEFVSAARREGICFSLQDVYDYPCAGVLAYEISRGENKPAGMEKTEISAAARVIANNIPDNVVKHDESEIGNLLLTGATGYLGAHILDEFLRGGEGDAYCIVRGGDGADSARRLSDTLRYYFGDKYANNGRIHAVCADLTNDRFGMDGNAYAELAEKTGTVINCAATVKHFGSYQFFRDANVRTAENVIDFCRHGGSRLVHISTISVSGAGLENQAYPPDEAIPFTERDLYISQPLDNVYARSKFEAETAVLRAAAEGLRANIMRMGELTNRRADGRFQPNYESNAFLNLLKSIFDLGMVPDYALDAEVEMSPVDEAADAVFRLTRHFNTENNLFHVLNGHSVRLGDLLRLFADAGMKTETVSGAAFEEALRSSASGPEGAQIMKGMFSAIDSRYRLCLYGSCRVESRFTEKALGNYGFEWRKIDREYISRYCRYFRDLGYFKNAV